MQMKNFVTFSILSTILVLGAVSIAETEAAKGRVTEKPHYNTGPYVAKITVRMDSDCWDEVYVRASDSKDASKLLNKQTFRNHPGETGWVKIVTSLKFKTEKLDTGRIRAYAVVDDGFDTDYQYKTFTNTQYEKQGFIDFSFHLNTNKALCQ